MSYRNMVGLKKESSVPAEITLNGEVDASVGGNEVSWNTMSFGQKCSCFVKNITVEPIIAFYIMPSSLASITTQNLNIEKACRVNLAYPDHVCTALAARNTTGFEKEEIAVQQLTAGMQSWKTVLQSALPAILILFIGAWSDRTGRRKPCMLFPILGEFLTCISLIICTYWFYELPMEIAGVSEALWPALFGGWFTMFMATFSYVSAHTSVESRTFRIGAVNIFVSAGVPIGTALSGVLYVKLGFYGVFTISAACYVFSFFYCLIRIREAPRSLAIQPEERAKHSCCASFISFFAFRSIFETIKVALKKGANNRRARVASLVIITMILFGPTHGEAAVSYLAMRYRFNWNEVQYSIFSTYTVVLHIFGMIASVGILSRLLKMDDALIGVLCCTSKILAAFVYAFATTDWVIYLAPAVDLIGNTSFIVMRAIASKLVPINELGKVSALFAVCEAFMPAVYGPLYSSVYRATLETLPGAFYLVGGALTLPGTLLFLWLYFEHRGDKAREAAKKAHDDSVDRKEESNSSDVKRGLKNTGFEIEQL